MWSDTESDRDYLNFGEVSQLTVDILNNPNMLPTSIGIFGNWGSGKSSLLKLIESKLNSSESEDKKQQKIIIRFDAWLYQGYDDARAALLEVIATELNKSVQQNEKLTKKIGRLLKRINIFRFLGLAAEGAASFTGIPTGGLISRGINVVKGVWDDGIQDQEEYENLKKTGEDTTEQANQLIKEAEQQKSAPQQIDAFRKEYNEVLEELDKPVVIIIDNLDRCLPSNAIHTLEAIRLFLFLNKTAFIIAVDEEMIRTSVANYFKGASEQHQIDYLDKLIQIPIRVPKIGVREIRSYLFMLYAIEQNLSQEKLDQLQTELEKALQQSWKDAPISYPDVLGLINETSNIALVNAYERTDRIAPILANSPFIYGNPRIVKRLLNVVKMRASVARRRSMPLDEAIITKLVIFERCAGAQATADFYNLINAEKGKPRIFNVIENDTDDNQVLIDDFPESWKLPTTKPFILEWIKLEPLLRGVDLRAAIYLARETALLGSYIITLSSIGKDTLNTLINIENISSPSAENAIKLLPLEEQIPVMEGIINHLRQFSDWHKKPKGFIGGCLLAKCSPDAAKVFKRFINSIEWGDTKKTPLWMQALLKNEHWYNK